MTEPILCITDLCKSYRAPNGPELPVLKGVNLSLSSGEALSITGPSGCGKSTLLNLIGTLDHPDSGSIRFNGNDVQNFSERQAAKLRSTGIGFIFQMHHLLPQCTALENVLMPALAAGTTSKSDTLIRAHDLLKRVGLGERADYRPGQLSGGECQRVAVVRALINRPTLLLADEPTGALDRKNADDLTALLYDLQQDEKLAMILVTHAEELAGTASRKLILTDGVLQEEPCPKG